METQKTITSQTILRGEKKKMELEEASFLASDYTTKVQ